MVGGGATPSPEPESSAIPFGTEIVFNNTITIPSGISEIAIEATSNYSVVPYISKIKFNGTSMSYNDGNSDYVVYSRGKWADDEARTLTVADEYSFESAETKNWLFDNSVILDDDFLPTPIFEYPSDDCQYLEPGYGKVLYTPIDAFKNGAMPNKIEVFVERKGKKYSFTLTGYANNGIMEYHFDSSEETAPMYLISIAAHGVYEAPYTYQYDADATTISVGYYDAPVKIYEIKAVE